MCRTSLEAFFARLGPDGVGRFNRSTGSRVAELVEKAVGELGGGTPSVHSEASIKGEIYRNFADITKARMELGWEPRCRLEEEIFDLVKWWKASEDSR